MTEEIEKQNVRHLLFVDFGIEPEKAKAYLESLDKHPEKVEEVSRLLMKNLSEQYEAVKEKTQNELVILAKDRASAWRELIGPLSIPELVAMNKQWDIPVDSILDRKVTPELIKQMLDTSVIGQEDYKINLSVAFYTYYMHRRRAGLRLPKSNLLVVGPSGSGKTYGMQVLSKLFHIPFIVIHCNNLVQEGIVGPGLTDGFTQLLQQGWQKEEIEHAVVCFDEFDKLFEKNQSGEESGRYNSRVVNEMLNIIDDKGEEVFKENFETRNMKQIKLPTRKMMFVFTGDFNGLMDKKKKNIAPPETPKVRKIGFRVQEEPPTTIPMPVIVDEDPTDDDFLEFGVKSEILGRVQNFVFLNELTEDDLVALFDLGDFSPFSEFEQYFSCNGINAILTEEGKRTLAKIACQRKLGVRGLSGLLKKVLTEDMFDLDVGESNVLEITKQYILDNLNKK